MLNGSEAKVRVDIKAVDTRHLRQCLTKIVQLCGKTSHRSLKPHTHFMDPGILMIQRLPWGVLAVCCEPHSGPANGERETVPPAALTPRKRGYMGTSQGFNTYPEA